MRQRLRFPHLSSSEEIIRELARLKEENARLQRELHRDDLTGLYNARCLRERLRYCIEERHQSGDQPVLLFLDVDGFKQVNETHGHLAAGKILGDLGRLLSRWIRLEDLAFRYGGDEFVILVSGGEAGARRVAERIRQGLLKHRFVARGLHGKARLALSVSVGIRVIRMDDTPEGVLEEADRAMFEAKRRLKTSETSVSAA